MATLPHPIPLIFYETIISLLCCFPSLQKKLTKMTQERLLLSNPLNLPMMKRREMCSSIRDFKKHELELEDDNVSLSSTQATDVSITSIDESEDEFTSRKVQFCPATETREIESCYSMPTLDRQILWYGREELSQMKLNAKKTVRQMRSECKDTLLRRIKSCHDQSIFIAELSKYGGSDSLEMEKVSGCLSCDMKEWVEASVAGEACRGIEKRFLRRDREMFAHEARRAVTLAPCKSDIERKSVADTYKSYSRHSVVFAIAMARADAAVANQ